MVYHLASGNAFFSGMLLVIAGCVASICARKWWGRSAAALAAMGGAALVGCSAVPLAPPVYWGLGLLAIVWAIAQSLSLRIERGVSRWLAGALALFCTVTALGELRYRTVPSVPSGCAGTVYVIGDSLSAGVGQGEGEPWPVLLSRRCGSRVVNLSRAGATLRGARGRAAEVSEQLSTVILEVGGNDMLGGRRPQDFARDLRALLLDVRPKTSEMLMFELPLMPGQNEYGLAQRRLAKELSVKLIPRKVLARAITGKGNTLDGLHLSAQGHRLLAEVVRRMVHKPGGEADGENQ